MTRRPEGGQVEGEPPPRAGLPRGEFCSTTGSGGYRIERADPEILISEELIVQAGLGLLRPEIVLDVTAADPVTSVGALLKVYGVNRQVVYRLTEWVQEIRSYVGEWPE